MSRDNQLGLEPTKENLDPQLKALFQNLSEFQNEYGAITQYLRSRLVRGVEEDYAKNRACGPSSFILGKFVQENLKVLPLKACFSNNVPDEDGIYIVSGFENDPTSFFEDVEIDHGWVIVKYKGQVAIISPESSHTSAEASIRGSIVYPKGVTALYKLFGMREGGEENFKEYGMDDDELNLLKKVMADITEGKIPEVYRQWYELFLRYQKNSVLN